MIVCLYSLVWYSRIQLGILWPCLKKQGGVGIEMEFMLIDGTRGHISRYSYISLHSHCGRALIARQNIS